MGKKNLTFADIETEKSKFYRHKSPIFLKDADITKVLVCNKISSGEETMNTLLVTYIMIIKLSLI